MKIGRDIAEIGAVIAGKGSGLNKCISSGRAALDMHLFSSDPFAVGPER